MFFFFLVHSTFSVCHVMSNDRQLVVVNCRVKKTNKTHTQNEWHAVRKIAVEGSENHHASLWLPGFLTVLRKLIFHRRKYNYIHSYIHKDAFTNALS